MDDLSTENHYGVAAKLHSLWSGLVVGICFSSPFTISIVQQRNKQL